MIKLARAKTATVAQTAAVALAAPKRRPMLDVDDLIARVALTANAVTLVHVVLEAT